MAVNKYELLMNKMHYIVLNTERRYDISNKLINVKNWLLILSL